MGLIVFAQIATRNIQQVPSGTQNFWEWLVESLHNFLEGIIGPQLVKRTFWFFATIFIFILFANWCGLIPGIRHDWLGRADRQRFRDRGPVVSRRQCRLEHDAGDGADVFCLLDFLGIAIKRADRLSEAPVCAQRGTTGLLKVLMVVVFFAVGFLEIFSILFRPISLSFRLYGNIFAGENMLEAMSNLVPDLGWLLPVPFYFMELLVGVIQALVFMLLTAVFTMLIMPHDEGHEKGASLE